RSRLAKAATTVATATSSTTASTLRTRRHRLSNPMSCVPTRLPGAPEDSAYALRRHRHDRPRLRAVRLLRAGGSAISSASTLPAIPGAARLAWARIRPSAAADGGERRPAGNQDHASDQGHEARGLDGYEAGRGMHGVAK